MTKKDFQVLADHINVALLGNKDIIDALCAGLHTINSNFNKTKFLAACCEGISVAGPSVKIGDKVRVVNTDWSKGLWYKVGDEGVVTYVRDEDPAGGYSVDIDLATSGGWICRDYELEVIG